jgi:hypothetical protein
MSKAQQLEQSLKDIERAVEMQRQADEYPRACLPEASLRVVEKSIARMREILKKGKKKKPC